jgi:hypothetical protein
VPIGALTAEGILDVADAGREQDAPERGRLLLGAALGSDVDVDLLDVDLGTRDALVLELRAATLGDELVGHLWCPACGTQLAVRLTAASLRRPTPAGEAVVEVEVDGWRVAAVSPDGRALAAAARCVGVEAARASLLESCVVEARGPDGDEVGSADVPDAVAEAVGGALVARDPSLDVRIGVSCAACDHAWSCCFDASAYFWIEVDALGARILDEVHSLATGYGWTEADVLELSSSRRRRYVERLAGG